MEKKRYAKPECFGKAVSERQRGISMEERLGPEKWAIARAKLVASAKRSYEDRMGREVAERVKKGKRERIISDEMRERLSETSIGRLHSEETKEKLRQANLGENNPMYGKTASEETRRKMGDAHRTGGKYGHLKDTVKLCECGCRERIEWRLDYAYHGYPQFKKNHHMRLPRAQLYGSEERAKEIAMKTGSSWRGKRKPESFCKRISEIQTGKSYEQRFGKEKAEKIRRLKSEWIRQHPYCNVGHNEKEILDIIEEHINYTINRLFGVRMHNGDIPYKPDGYVHELNIIIEVDEEGHNGKQLKKDAKREHHIKELLPGCRFFRIKEPEFIRFMNSLEHFIDRGDSHLVEINALMYIHNLAVQAGCKDLFDKIPTPPMST